MVGHDDPVGPGLDGQLGVLGMQHALQDQVAAPLVADFLEDIPGLYGEGLLGVDAGHLDRAGLGRRVGLPVFQIGNPVGQIGDQPARMAQRFQLGCEPGLIGTDPAIADIALALGIDRHIDGDDQGLQPGIGHAVDQIGADSRVFWNIELVPGAGRGLGDRLNR